MYKDIIPRVTWIFSELFCSELLFSKYQCIFYPTHPKWVSLFVVFRFDYLQKHAAAEQLNCSVKEIFPIRTHNIA